MYVKKNYYFCGAKGLNEYVIRVQRYNFYLNCARKSVKKHQTYLVLFLALLLGGTASAKVDNYVGAYANLGEWTMLPSQSKFGPSLGVAGGLGALYELQVGPAHKTTRFLLDVGVGVQAGMTAFRQGGNMEAVLPNQTDLDGDKFDYVYSLQNRRDQYTDIAVNVPLLIGVQHKKFYMLAGVKLYSHVYSLSGSRAQLSTFGRYADFDEFHNMPEYQFFENRPVQSSVKTKLSLDLDACFEIGGRLGEVVDAVGFDVPKRKIEYRLAGFVEYGLFDLHKDIANKAEKALITPTSYDANDPSSPTYIYNNTNMVDNLVMNDIMSTTGFAKAVNNFVVGLKFTVLFQLPEPGTCVICRDSYRGSSPRRGSRRGMKYEE